MPQNRHLVVDRGRGPLGLRQGEALAVLLREPGRSALRLSGMLLLGARDRIERKRTLVRR